MLIFAPKWPILLSDSQSLSQSLVSSQHCVLCEDHLDWCDVTARHYVRCHYIANRSQSGRICFHSARGWWQANCLPAHLSINLQSVRRMHLIMCVNKGIDIGIAPFSLLHPIHLACYILSYTDLLKHTPIHTHTHTHTHSHSFKHRNTHRDIHRHRHRDNHIHTH